MKSHPCSTSLVPTKLALHNDSHTISKLKPKIRIIHIVAPEIIKTDVQNFRELVQRLTGKPKERKESEKKVSDCPSVAFPSKTCGRKPRKNLKPAIVPALQIKHRIKESEEIIWGENPSALLGFLGDVDGFIHDVNGFPLLPFRSSQINTFGGCQLRDLDATEIHIILSHYYLDLEVLDAVYPSKMESGISLGTRLHHYRITPDGPRDWFYMFGSERYRFDQLPVTMYR